MKAPLPVQAGQVVFVYGTLRSGSRHPMARLLRRHARQLGQGTVTGRLYRLGHYPGAIPVTDPRHRVKGDLYRLKTGARWLVARLDAYEGTEYTRTRIRVVGERHRVMAWIYVLRRQPDPRNLIVGGDWLAPQPPAA